MRIRNELRPFDFNDEAHAAVKAFRDARPWRGTLAERGEKFEALHRGLCKAYDLETMLVRDGAGDLDHVECSGRSRFDRCRNRIVQSGRLSVVTYLFLFGLAAGAGRQSAMSSARGAFARYFPRSFARCVERRGLLVKA